MQLFGVSLFIFTLFISLSLSYNHRFNSLVNLLRPNADADEQDDSTTDTTTEMQTKADQKPDNIFDDSPIDGDEEKIDSVYLKKVVFKLREYVNKVMDGLTSIENRIEEIPADSSDNKKPEQTNRGGSTKKPGAKEDVTTESDAFDGDATTTRTVTESQSDYELLGGDNEESSTTKINCEDCKHCCEQLAATSTETAISAIKRSFSNLVKKREKNTEKWSKWSDWSGNRNFFFILITSNLNR